MVKIYTKIGAKCWKHLLQAVINVMSLNYYFFLVFFFPMSLDYLLSDKNIHLGLGKDLSASFLGAKQISYFMNKYYLHVIKKVG